MRVVGSATACTMQKESDESNHKMLSVRHAACLIKLGETISEE
jgi:hypothetical protein